MIWLMACAAVNEPFVTPVLPAVEAEPWACPGWELAEVVPLPAGAIARSEPYTLYDDRLVGPELVVWLEGAGRDLLVDGDEVWVTTSRGVERTVAGVTTRWATGGDPRGLAPSPEGVWVADATGRLLSVGDHGVREQVVDGWPQTVAPWAGGVLVGSRAAGPVGVGVAAPAWLGGTQLLASDGERLWAVVGDQLLEDGALLSTLAGQAVGLRASSGTVEVQIRRGATLRWTGEALEPVPLGGAELVELAGGSAPAALGADGVLYRPQATDLGAPGMALLRWGEVLLAGLEDGLVEVDTAQKILEGDEIWGLAPLDDARVVALVAGLGAMVLARGDEGLELRRTLPADEGLLAFDVGAMDSEPVLFFLSRPAVALGGDPWRYESLASLARHGERRARPRLLGDGLYVPQPGTGLERVEDHHRWRFDPGAHDVVRLGDELVVARGDAGILVLDDAPVACSLPGTVERVGVQDGRLLAMSRSAWFALEPR